MNHVIKCEQPYFEAILDGRKTFEIRFNDRGYQAGDTVTLLEIRKRFALEETGREITKRITYVTGYNQHPNWVVFGMGDLEPVSE